MVKERRRGRVGMGRKLSSSLNKRIKSQRGLEVDIVHRKGRFTKLLCIVTDSLIKLLDSKSGHQHNKIQYTQKITIN